MLLHHLLIVHGLWYAPIYAWLLLVSAWARRAPFLWASLPLLAIGVVERIAFNTSHFGAMLAHRMIGGPGGDDFMAGSLSMDPLMHFTPGAFLSSPVCGSASRSPRYSSPLRSGCAATGTRSEQESTRPAVIRAWRRFRRSPESCDGQETGQQHRCQERACQMHL
jgi:hypothetical protein